MKYSFVSSTNTLTSSSTELVPGNIFISDKLKALINFRINQEEYSSRIYHAMYLFLEDKGFFTGAKLWKKFADEEMAHADKAREFLFSINIRPESQAIAAPPTEYYTFGDVVSASLAHEIEITKQCQTLYNTAVEEKNPLAITLAHEFINIQIHELKEYYDLQNLYNIYVGDALSEALFDHELEKYL